MRKWAVSAGLAVVLSCLLVSPAYAQSASPDSVSIDVIYVNRHLLETNDQLYLCYYNIEYTTIPDDPADETFLFRLIDTDGTTELGRMTPYVYANSGYGEGVISFYFAAADAPTWGEEYIVRVSENPAHFTSPQEWNFGITTTDYTEETTQSANRADVESYILAFAADLETAWSTTLTESQDPGVVLNSSGEAYFRNAVFGAMTMAPGVFFYQTLDINYTERTWNTTQATTYEERFDGTWVGNATGSMANLFRVDNQVFPSIMIILMSILAMWISARYMESPHPGFAVCMMLVLGGAALGWVGMVFLAIMGLFMVLYLAYFLFYQHA